jgi:sulfotransferase
MQKIHFVSGLPRSGSTLLQNILAQNPKAHSTPTSGLVNFFMNCKTGWKDNNEFRSQGLEEVENRIKGSFRGIIDGFYSKELAEGKFIFEKSRGWMAYIEYLKDIYQNSDLKVIACVRDVRAIVASFEKLYRKRSISYPEFSNEGRCEILLRNNGVVGLPIVRLRDVLRRSSSSLLIVRYKDLLENPQQSLQILHDVLGIPSFKYNFDEIKQVVKEYDVYHGYQGLHDIKEGAIISPKGIPWDGMFEQGFLESMTNAYSDINRLAND